MSDVGIIAYLKAAQLSEADGLIEYPEIIEMLDELDSLFRSFVTGKVSPVHNPATMVLAQSAHASFLAAAGTALRGQFAPTFMIIRGFIESALYSYLAARSEEDAEIWLKRGSNPQATKQRFKAGRAIDILRTIDPNLSTMLKETYGWSIEFGAHPNFLSVLESLRLGETIEDGEEFFSVNMTYIHSQHSAPYMRALIAVVENACVAITVLCHTMGPEHPQGSASFKNAWDIFSRAQAWLKAQGYTGHDASDTPK